VSAAAPTPASQGGLLDAAKLRILAASIVSAAAGLTLLSWLSRRGRTCRVAIAPPARQSDRVQVDHAPHVRPEATPRPAPDGSRFGPAA